MYTLQYLVHNVLQYMYMYDYAYRRSSYIQLIRDGKKDLHTATARNTHRQAPRSAIGTDFKYMYVRTAVHVLHS